LKQVRISDEPVRIELNIKELIYSKDEQIKNIEEIEEFILSNINYVKDDVYYTKECLDHLHTNDISDIKIGHYFKNDNIIFYIKKDNEDESEVLKQPYFKR